MKKNCFLVQGSLPFGFGFIVTLIAVLIPFPITEKAKCLDDRLRSTQAGSGRAKATLRSDLPPKPPASGEPRSA